MKHPLSLVLALALVMSVAALAESEFDFDATVVCVQPEYVTAAIGGTVATVPVMAGERIAAGDALAELNTVKVYAGGDGTVTGLFCAPGDSIPDIVARYGALMYIEPDSKYTLTASTDSAYNASANRYVHVGEAVYLASSDGGRKGEGFVTAVNGAEFNVEVTEGGFTRGETLSVYRQSSRAAKSRIGRGDVERIANLSVTGPENGGSVVVMHVSEGSRVKAGDLLMETLSGEYDARYCTGSTLKSAVDGIVASVSVQPGQSVVKGDVIATVYPSDRFQLEIQVNEADLSVLPVGTPVTIRFNWNEDDEAALPCPGTVSRILYTPITDNSQGDSGDAATYAAYVDFAPDADVRLGMTATVRTAGSAAAEDDEALAEAEDEDEDEDEIENGKWKRENEGRNPSDFSD